MPLDSVQGQVFGARPFHQQTAHRRTAHKRPIHQWLAVKLAFALAVVPLAVHAELPEGWFQVGDDHSNYEVGRADDAGKSGPGFYIRSVEKPTGTFSGIGQAVSAENYRGEHIAWEARVSTEAVAGWAGLWMRVDGKGGQVLEFDNMQSRGLTGDNDWEHYTIVLEVAEEAESVVFGALLSGEGSVYLDQMSFEVTEEESKSTNRELPLEPQNLDF